MNTERRCEIKNDLILLERLTSVPILKIISILQAESASLKDQTLLEYLCDIKRDYIPELTNLPELPEEFEE